jgi:hypothetical protein
MELAEVMATHFNKHVYFLYYDVVYRISENMNVCCLRIELASQSKPCAVVEKLLYFQIYQREPALFYARQYIPF